MCTSLRRSCAANSSLSILDRERPLTKESRTCTPGRQHLAGPPFDPSELEFRGSPEVTLGVELELQILEKGTGDLVPGADAHPRRRRRRGNRRHRRGVPPVDARGEDSHLPRTSLKSATPCSCSCGGPGTPSSAVGYDLGLGGTHPLSLASKTAVSPGLRYERIRHRQGWLAYQEAIYGLHVHVGVPDAERAIGLINLLTPYLPHLLALSANSPFSQGIDTEFASARAILFRPSAQSGIPLHFADRHAFGDFYRLMRENGVFGSPKDLYWDLRPRPDFGTIEFRICDAPATLAQMLALAALIRCMVVDGLRQMERDPKIATGDRGRHWLACENKTLAARYGVKALCVRQPGEERRSLASEIDELLARLQLVADAADETQFLLPLRIGMDRFESASSRRRRLYRQSGDWRTVLDDMRGPWTRELEDAIVVETRPASTTSERRGPIEEEPVEVIF